ncbi:MAG: CBS domain-containing protein, partial [Sneathiella sp.]|nr:CBS domain-containing protein [Sneathiella sp.]
PATSYVEAFVKDVNRARALTVENVMKPPVGRITATTIGEALKQMKKFSNDYGYVVTDEGYQGIILQETLEQEAKSNSLGEIEQEFMEEVPSISPDSVLEEIIPETLSADYPLPVVGKEGDLQGQLARSSLAEVLGSERK